MLWNGPNGMKSSIVEWRSNVCSWSGVKSSVMDSREERFSGVRKENSVEWSGEQWSEVKNSVKVIVVMMTAVSLVILAINDWVVVTVIIHG